MRHFSARETVWLQELDGIELASFHRRAFAFIIDWSIVGIALSIVLSLGGFAIFTIARLAGHPIHVSTLDLHTGAVAINANDAPPPAAPSPAPHSHIHFQLGNPTHSDDESALTAEHPLAAELLKFFSDILLPVLYFGILLWRGKGRTPGKRLMKIRVVSIVHPHLTFWHSVERALGYGAAALEAGFGFAQFFIHPYRRCAQDRLAETIVVTERGYQKMLAKPEPMPSE